MIKILFTFSSVDLSDKYCSDFYCLLCLSFSTFVAKVNLFVNWYYKLKHVSYKNLFYFNEENEFTIEDLIVGFKNYCENLFKYFSIFQF